MKATKQYFPVVLFIIMLYKVEAIEPMDKIINCDHSSESCTCVLDFPRDNFRKFLKFYS